MTSSSYNGAIGNDKKSNDEKMILIEETEEANVKTLTTVSGTAVVGNYTTQFSYSHRRRKLLDY